MRTIIAGSRSVSSYQAVEQAVLASGFTITTVISGGARGVDTLAEHYGRQNGIPVEVYPAKWDDLQAPGAVIKTQPRGGKLYNAKAGLDRNELMASKADALIAIWDGVSRGTQHMIRVATERGLKVFVQRI